ncbi:hypothetical protein ACLOJK_023470 [Asimina triloba]
MQNDACPCKANTGTTLPCAKLTQKILVSAHARQWVRLNSSLCRWASLRRYLEMISARDSPKRGLEAWLLASPLAPSDESARSCADSAWGTSTSACSRTISAYDSSSFASNFASLGPR